MSGSGKRQIICEREGNNQRQNSGKLSKPGRKPNEIQRTDAKDILYFQILLINIFNNFLKASFYFWNLVLALFLLEIDQGKVRFVFFNKWSEFCCINSRDKEIISNSIKFNFYNLDKEQIRKENCNYLEQIKCLLGF